MGRTPMLEWSHAQADARAITHIRLTAANDAKVAALDALASVYLGRESHGCTTGNRPPSWYVNGHR